MVDAILPIHKKRSSSEDHPEKFDLHEFRRGEESKRIATESIGRCDTNTNDYLIFLTQPYSSNSSLLWALFTAALALGRVLEIGFQSIDGPNQYHGRKKDLSLYHFMPTRNEYWFIYIALMIPLVIDAALRCIVIGFIVNCEENKPIWHQLRRDYTELCLLTADVISVIPFLIRIFYFRPNPFEDASQAVQVMLTLMELLISARILRLIKDVPAIKAVRLALVRSAQYLVLPIFFFLVFNITAGVFLYFAEPCFNIDTCPWEDLFDSTYFSIVTMTTTGYGNQIPSYELGRFIACIIMVFGTLFLSMPLAIIGNEYDQVWEDINNPTAPSTEINVETVDHTAQNALKAHYQDQMLAQAIEEGNKEEISSDSEGSRSSNDSQDIGNDAAENLKLDAVGKEEQIRPSQMIVEQQAATEESPGGCYDAAMTLTHLIEKEQKFREERKKEIEQQLASDNVHMDCIVLKSDTAMHSDRFDSTDPVHFVYRNLRDCCISMKLIAQIDNQQFVHRITAFIMKVTEGRTWISALRCNIMAQINLLEYHRCSGTLSLVRAADDSKARELIQHPAAPAPTQGANGRRRRLSILGGGANSTSLQQQAPLNASRNFDLKNTYQSKEESRSDNNQQQIWSVDASSKQVVESGRYRRVVPHHASNEDGVLHDGHDEMREDGKNNPYDGEQEEPVQRRPHPMATRTSMVTRVMKLVNNSEELAAIKEKANSARFLDKIDRVSKNPNSVRSRIWLLLEVPQSSFEARCLQWMLIFLICISIFSLYTQTIVNLSDYGENTSICEQVVKLYCSDKNDASLDPGCYVQQLIASNASSSTIAVDTRTVDDLNDFHTEIDVHSRRILNAGTKKLNFDCSSNDCFGHGFNFGSNHALLTCPGSDHTDDAKDLGLDDDTVTINTKPFQDADELEKEYGPPYLFTSRQEMHRINPICKRIECIDNSNQYVNVKQLWAIAEFIINVIFSIEIFLRVIVSDNWRGYIFDWSNHIDIVSVIPFYVELLNGIASSTVTNLNFAILASSPEPIVLVVIRSLKVFRLFKITRHFNASKVLMETARRIWKQILGMLAFLVFLVILFAILLFEVEGGSECFIGDKDCDPPSDQTASLRNGDRVLINKSGDLSQFSNVFYGLWFSIVTLTSTGYGDIVPVTNAGLVMSIFVMIAGTFYMAMPLTAAASTFYQVHEHYKQQRKDARDGSLLTLPKSDTPSPQFQAKPEGTGGTYASALQQPRNSKDAQQRLGGAYAAGILQSMTCENESHMNTETISNLHDILHSLADIYNELDKVERMIQQQMNDSREDIVQDADNNSTPSPSVSSVDSDLDDNYSLPMSLVFDVNGMDEFSISSDDSMKSILKQHNEYAAEMKHQKDDVKEQNLHSAKSTITAPSSTNIPAIRLSQMSLLRRSALQMAERTVKQLEDFLDTGEKDILALVLVRREMYIIRDQNH